MNDWLEERTNLVNWKQVFWLASYPKSGNTWVRCFLDAYYTQKVDINGLIGASTDGYMAFATGTLGDDFGDIPPELKVLARPFGLLRMVDLYKKEERKYPLVLKTHNACVAANGINLIPWSMTKGVIYIIRNPIDVFPSLAAHFGHTLDEAIDMMGDTSRVIGGEKRPGDENYFARFPDFITSWSMHVSSYTTAVKDYNVLIVRYEDMLSKPEDAFSGILCHIGVQPDVDRVKQAIIATNLDALAKQEKELGFKELSPNATGDFFGGKREKPTQEQIDRLKQLLEPEFSNFY